MVAGLILGGLLLPRGSKMSKGGGGEFAGYEARRHDDREENGGPASQKGVTARGAKRQGGGRRRASIHIHPGVATGTLITCFNLPTADWASICHSKSVIARGATPSSVRPRRRCLWLPSVYCYYLLIGRLALSLNREPRRSRSGIITRLCSARNQRGLSVAPFSQAAALLAIIRCYLFSLNLRGLR